MKKRNNKTKITALSLLAVLSFCLGGCKKFLDAKPDKQLATPSSLENLTAILDARTMNTNFPSAPDNASDDYFLTNTSWGSISLLDARNDYIWDPNSANDFDWLYMYTEIESANVVLDGLAGIPENLANASAYMNVRGMALFFRGYALAELANVFTLPYDQANSAALPGLPIRLSSDINAKTTRSTMQETYSQAIADLKQSAALLPVTPVVKTRPSKPAAYGALARLYLTMGDYKNAKAYADSCLQLYHTLIDYNTVSTTASTPFPRFNDEVIFHATGSGRGGALNTSKAKVDTVLYQQYAANDLRKQVFYKSAGSGYYSFKGDYSGGNFGQPFNGLATNEVLLIRSESEARLGDGAGALNDLNHLLQNRWTAGTFAPYPATLSADSVVSLVLQERRKELPFTSGIRWSDLRRVSSDPKYSVIPKRLLNGQTYTLSPGDKRYAFLLPLSVVQLSGIQQNSR